MTLLRPANRSAAEFFARVPAIEWDDIRDVHRGNAALLGEIAGNRGLLRELVIGARKDPLLWRKSESGVVEDKIVLWDEPERGFRLRLRMATEYQQEMPHQHRFTFTNLVLRKHYTHRAYSVRGVFGEGTRVEDVSTECVHDDVAGHCFTIHHEAIHSTPLPEPGTINLVLRGPAVKDRAPVLFVEGRGDATANRNREEEPEFAERGHVFWRVGEKDESPERRAERQMTDATYRAWLNRFEEYGLI
ncbi:MAG: hypothetical protein ACJ74U_07065 [Jatrophihabitantaceae bacterium]